MEIYVVMNDDHVKKHGYSEVSGVALSKEDAEKLLKQVNETGVRFQRIIGFKEKEDGNQ
jgi:hypothetical protein